MAVNKIRKNVGYGFLANSLQELAPVPILATRPPVDGSDKVATGTLWIDTLTDIAYVAVDQSVFTTAPMSGATILASLQVTPGNAEVSLGDFEVSVGNTILGGTLDVTGATTVADLVVTGDFDMSSAALIDLTSTLDAAPSIYLHANGGTSEQILLRSDLGTSVSSISLLSDVGGVTINAGLASADAINLEAGSGGIDMDAALQINIASSQNAANAIAFASSAGGMTFTASGGAAEDIVFTNSASIVGTASESVSDAIVFNASGAAGGLQLKAGTGGVLIGNEADTTTIDVGNFAPTAARTITVGGGTVVTAAVTDTIDIGVDGATTNANSIKVVNIGTGVVTTGENNVNINTGTAASGTQTTNIATGTGGGTKAVNIGNADGLTTVTINGITSFNPSVNGNIDFNGGTSTGTFSVGNALAGAMTVDSAAGISLDAATVSNFTVTGAGADLNLLSVGGSVLVDSTENAALAIRLHANGGTSETIQLHADQGTGVGSINLLSDVGGITVTAGLATADAINLVTSNAGGGIDIDAGTAGIAVDTTGAFSIDGAAASNVTTTGAGIDLTLASVLGSVLVSSTENAALAIRLHANGGTSETIQLHSDLGTGVGSINLLSDVGGITLTATGLASDDAINLVAGAGGVDIDGAMQINIASSEAAGDAVLLSASDAIGGITLDSSAAAGVTFTNGTQVFQMMVGTGSPNGSLAAAQGSLYVNVAGNSGTTVLYCNTDGSTAWSVVGV